MPLNFDPQLAGAASAAAQRAMEDAAVAARLVSEVAKDDSEEEKLAHQRRMDALARVSKIRLLNGSFAMCSMWPRMAQREKTLHSSDTWVRWLG